MSSSIIRPANRVRHPTRSLIPRALARGLLRELREGGAQEKQEQGGRKQGGSRLQMTGLRTNAGSARFRTIDSENRPQKNPSFIATMLCRFPRNVNPAILPVYVGGQ